MLNRDYRDVIAGVALTTLGLVISAYAISHYATGTVTRMGPGMVPAGLGVILAVFGIIISVTAWFREGDWPSIKVATPLVVLASVLIFAVTVDRLGLIPAVFLSVFTATLAELTFHPVRNLILAAALCLLAYLVFQVALGLPVPPFAWRF